LRARPGRSTWHLEPFVCTVNTYVHREHVWFAAPSSMAPAVTILPCPVIRSPASFD
jgi:hypothetical protein